MYLAELPASQNFYEFHPAFDHFFDVRYNPDCENYSVCFVEHGKKDWESSEEMHGYSLVRKSTGPFLHPDLFHRSLSSDFSCFKWYAGEHASHGYRYSTYVDADAPLCLCFPAA